MDTAAQVLLIIVSSVLSVFLIVLIIALVYVIIILKAVKRVMARAEEVADSVEAATAAFERAASPLAILKTIGNIVDQVTRIKRKDK